MKPGLNDQRPAARHRRTLESMPVQPGDEVEVPEGEGWIRDQLVRRGTDADEIERPSSVLGDESLRVPVWIVRYLEGPRAGETGPVPNGTIARVIL